MVTTECYNRTLLGLPRGEKHGKSTLGMLRKAELVGDDIPSYHRPITRSSLGSWVRGWKNGAPGKGATTTILPAGRNTALSLDALNNS